MAIITISRGTFSGGQQLAETVAERLGYRCVSREILADAANEYGIQERKLYEALAKKPGLLEKLHNDKVHYLAIVRAALAKEAQADNLVYHGHAGHLLLGHANHIIKIRVIADMKFRVEAAMERYNINRDEASSFISKVDKERSHWTRFLYHVDWQDASLYDLVLHIDHSNMESSCDIVCKMAEMDKFRTTPESQKVMDDLVLSSTVEAVLATHREIRDGDIQVKANGPAITIFGTVDSLFDADKVRVVARKIPGVEDIDTKMRIRTPVM